MYTLVALHSTAYLCNQLKQNLICFIQKHQSHSLLGSHLLSVGLKASYSLARNKKPAWYLRLLG